MKRWILALVLILPATPLFAQETGGGEGGFGGLFGLGDAPTNRNAPPPDRLPALRKIMADANTPLTKDQETALSKMLEADIKKYTDELEKKYPEEVAKVRAAQGNRGEQGGGGPGGDRRGGGGPPDGGGQGRGFGGRGRGSVLPPDSPLLAEMNRINVELQNKVVATLKPEQQASLKKYQNDQIKKAGGFPALKLNMQEAGAALTADQEKQIQAVYNDEDEQRQQLTRESQGQPDKAKMDALTNATMLKVAKLLTADQKKVLLESLKKHQPK
jgi:hypothetical protein